MGSYQGSTATTNTTHPPVRTTSNFSHLISAIATPRRKPVRCVLPLSSPPQRSLTDPGPLSIVTLTQFNHWNAIQGRRTGASKMTRFHRSPRLPLNTRPGRRLQSIDPSQIISRTTPQRPTCFRCAKPYTQFLLNGAVAAHNSNPPELKMFLHTSNPAITSSSSREGGVQPRGSPLASTTHAQFLRSPPGHAQAHGPPPNPTYPGEYKNLNERGSHSKT
ncbi:hypothetical protein M758_1G083600 [Ceratodon purpureus]|uniref:Uncharacterized protein n=1 Tax=Ceratodon purpureus TaxID=3225 RepID=A0A8T0J5R8_CERPU|nr:hypothetical protein KC19_1G085000 [Ceratodon purpureus]KAG0590258.1 hypothetical protein KC19_1G085200 [Ceratodon purpureus]KAG0629189.1 hypothetical protein M758_1G083400 [Ceratodon purpureus]KAG0629191.1 hypothetical protein M758_1G083600 [Ceratodon purpureus]